MRVRKKSAGHRAQGTGRRGQGAGDRAQGTGRRGQRKRLRDKETESLTAPMVARRLTLNAFNGN